MRAGVPDPPTFHVYDQRGEFLFECTADLPQWQDCDWWMFNISRQGFLSSPANPGQYPVVYMLILQ